MKINYKMSNKRDASKDLVTCLLCLADGAKKTEFRRKYIVDHNRSKHSGQLPSYKLSSHLTVNKITDVFQRQKQNEHQGENESGRMKLNCLRNLVFYYGVRGLFKGCFYFIIMVKITEIN